MLRVWPILMTAAVFMLTLPVAGAMGLTIDAIPKDPHIGDTVTFSGTVTKSRCI